ncbi:copper amine oxidase N-terminal domain-containing protein [Peptococcus simiae]|uniref:Copper amine oxidase N-terminal domain-containing protein n=1 Tax=Peptococcus simiae TaxID=1643805 RepID=A0ABW9H0X1_9FIRM
MKKKIIVAVATGALFFSALPAHAASVVVKDRPLILSQPAFIENGRTFVPMRAIFEALGATVNWNGTTRTVTGILNGKVVTLNNPKIINGRTMVPLRYISETLGSRVDWQQATQTAYVDSQVPQTYSRVVYGPHSLQDPGQWTLTLLGQSNNTALLVTKHAPFDQPFPRTSYSATLLTWDGQYWRGSYASRCWIGYEFGGNLKGWGNETTFRLLMSQYPELAGKRISFTARSNSGPARDRLVTITDSALIIKDDMSMKPNAGSGLELPRERDNQPNPAIGITVPRV